jgi:hypothetical protein
MSELVWNIVGDYENCHMPHILEEERKHEDAVESIFTCLDCLEEGIRKAERERIIKLLEDYGQKEYEFTLTAERDLIALIKGEK